MPFLRKYYSQLLFLLIGLLAGFFISRLPIKFEENVSWVALANFFLTILLAIYLEFVVRPSFSNNRNEKDILIDLIDEVKDQLSEIHEFYSKIKHTTPVAQNDKDELVAKFRVLSNRINILKHADSYCTITKEDRISKSIFDSYLKYKKALTGYDFSKNTFSFTRPYWRDHDNNFKSFTTVVIRSIIDINKL